jgi:hypothetical protein
MFCGSASAITKMFGPVETSVEWSVFEADRVVRGTVRPGLQRDVTVQGVRWREVTLDVGETIKGEPLEQVMFLMDAGEALAKVEKTWADVLVFLKWMEGGVEANKASDRLGGWRAERGLVFVLDQRTPEIYQMDGTVVADGEGLLKVVRAEAAFERRPKVTFGLAMVFLDTALARPPGLSRSLKVPQDERLEQLARGWLEDGDPALRSRGMYVLEYFPSAENAARLRRLLADPVFEVPRVRKWSPKLEERARKDFPLRRQAASTFEIWNQPPGEPVEISAPFLRYAPVAWGGWAIALGVIFAVALLWPGRWGSLGLGGRVAIVGVGLMVIVAVLRWRSGRGAESYSFSSGGGADYEVVLAAGRVGMLRVQDQAPPHGWMLRRFEKEEVGGEGGFWFASMMTPTEQVGQGGVYFVEGRTTGTEAYSYRFITLPYWVLVTAAGAWPAVWGMGRVRQARRRRRWLRANRCGRCGYDLRGHTGEGRCPECGEENAPRRAGRRAGVVVSDR